MSDPVVGEIFAAVALPMCLLVLAFLFSDYIRDRDAARRARDQPQPASPMRMAAALRQDP